MSKTDWRSPTLILTCGAIILTLSLGIRHGFGLFMQPISADTGWGREVLAFALALQNLIWGIAQPFTGMIADRYGVGRVAVVGSALYAGGLAMMALSGTQTGLTVGAGLLIGLGLSGTSFSVIFGAIGRSVSPERRSMALGIASAVGSFGQFAMVPGTQVMISGLGWPMTLLVLAGFACLIAPLAVAVEGTPRHSRTEPELTITAALMEAFRHRGFWLLCFGFFVCGFQVVFIAVHLPAYLLDRGLPLATATTVLALVGLFNIAGTYLAGMWGATRRKPLLLTGIYLARGVVIVLFLLAPISQWTAYAFGIGMGLLWLSTVPLTNGTVASVFGVRNLSMLSGIVFLFHQIGSFLGGWLGGYFYDRTGSYDVVWMMAIALSLVAGLLNFPITETPVARMRPAVEPS